MSIRKTSHARYEIWYHIAWSTKYRKKVFNKVETRESVKRLLRKIAAEYDMEIAKIEVMSDHVHMMISAPPRIAPSRAVQILKSVSTKALFKHWKWLKSLYWGGEVWVAGYFVRTVGSGLTTADIEKYIEKQSEES